MTEMEAIVSKTFVIAIPLLIFVFIQESKLFCDCLQLKATKQTAGTWN